MIKLINLIDILRRTFHQSNPSILVTKGIEFLYYHPPEITPKQDDSKGYKEDDKKIANARITGSHKTRWKTNTIDLSLILNIHSKKSLILSKRHFLNMHSL
jgi:hypothetical protein